MNLDRKHILDQAGTLESLFELDFSQMDKLYRKHLNPSGALVMKFLGNNRRYVRAKGMQVYDDKGNAYLDFLSGFGAVNLGHEPDEVLIALALCEGRPNIFQSAFNPAQVKLAELLSLVAPGHLTRSFFCNSGAEAVEAALKLARVATRRKVLIYAEGAYHGKTFGALSVSGRKKYRQPFEPLLPDTEVVPYGDSEVLHYRLMRQDVAGVILEPIQGENGVVLPPPGYLKKVEEICRQNGTLLLMDEIQTGMGRTGKLFCVNHENVEPDILILSKTLSGGVIPVGAIVTKDEIWKKAYGTLETAFLHSSTFGGNLRACACGFAALRSLIEHDWISNAEQIGAKLLQGLKELQKRYTVLEDVRGKGLMIGLSVARFKGNSRIAEGMLTLWLARQLLKRHKIITAFTLNNLDTLRIAPPLIVNSESADYFLNAMEDVLKSAEKFRWFQLLQQN